MHPPTTPSSLRRPPSALPPSSFILHPSSFPPSSSRRGAALIVVLGLLAVLMIMAMAFAISMRTERGGASNLRHATVARQMLDTAISRAMEDLDEELGIQPTPLWMAYASTNRFGADGVPYTDHQPADVLSYEAAECIPPDQLLAARRANPGWLPITGGVSADGGNDVISGRYAYLVLNNCGYLDADLVGANPVRSNGLTAAEIRLWDKTGGLSVLPDEAAAKKFAKQRADNHGRYESTAEFLRLTPKTLFDGTDNSAAGSLSMVLNKDDKFSTNSFVQSSFALDAPAPHVAGSITGDEPYGVRPPKLDISKGSLDTYSAAKGDAIRQTFEKAFAGAKAAFAASGVNASGSAQNMVAPCDVLAAPSPPYFPQSFVATAALLDYVDEDLLPGRKKIDDNEYVEYAKYPGIDHWSCRPCSEPVPMFDRFQVFQEFDGKVPTESVYHTKTSPDPGNPANTITTHVFPFKILGGAVYLNRVIPTNVLDSVFELDFHVFNPTLRIEEFSGASAATRNGLIAALETWAAQDLHVHETYSADLSMRQINLVLENLQPLRLNWPSTETIPFPSQFTIDLDFLAYVKVTDKYGDLETVQIVPGQKSDDDATWNRFLRLSVIVEPPRLMIPPDANNPFDVAGWAYASDARFAYQQDDLNALASITWMRRDLAIQLASDPSRDGALRAWANTIEQPRTRKHIETGHVSPFAQFLLTTATAESFCGGGTPVVGGAEMFEWSDTLYSGMQKNDFTEVAVLTMVRNDYPESVGELGNLVLAPLRTVSLFDGTVPGAPDVVTPCHNVLDWFTVHKPRGLVGSTGDPYVTDAAYLTAKLTNGRVNLNPPFVATLSKDKKVVTSDEESNYEPLTAVFAGLPLNEYGINDANQKHVRWEQAARLAEIFIDDVLWWEAKCDVAPNKHYDPGYNKSGITYDLSVLGRTPPEPGSPRKTPDPSKRLDRVLTSLYGNPSEGPQCDFEREAIIRNSVELLTTRQQLFTIVLRADAFTPKFGFDDAGQGTTLSTAHAIVEVWRDPEPMRDANGEVIRLKDFQGKTLKRPFVHPWFIRYLHQF